MQALVINSGSSSLKFELFEFETSSEGSESGGQVQGRSLVAGEVERIGSLEAHLRIETRAGGGAGPPAIWRQVEADDHTEALRLALEALFAEAVPGARNADLAVVGHRVVHGGARLIEPAIVTDDVIGAIREVALLAPLHTKANLAGITAARSLLPGVPQVAVFDTAFHRTLPERAYEYALPRELAQTYGIRRYGFHGTSHEYVARRAALLLGRPFDTLDLITMHLGNGASVTAVHHGRSIDTSMGMTPLEGLVMGTRSGDVDPAIPMLLGELSERTREEVNQMLNAESGLLGVCGVSDMREVHELAEAGDEDAQLALDLFCYRAKKYLGAYLAVLGRLDALVFTAGIGENDPEVRARICEGLDGLGIELDEAANHVGVSIERFISAVSSDVPVLVIPTDEEREIARQALERVGVLPHTADAGRRAE